MNRIDLLDPLPRKKPLKFNKFEYGLTNKHYLPLPEAAPKQDFFSIIESRRTRREFGEISEDSLSILLWYCCKVLDIYDLPNGLTTQHRCPPSGGGIHPIDVLLLERDAHRIALYDPIAHALGEIDSIDLAQMDCFLGRIEELVSIQKATVFWFAAEFDRTLSRYTNGESIVWRDAGVLVAAFCFVAEALNLNCCPLGITGEPFVSSLLNSSRFLVGVGGCLVGSKMKAGGTS